MRQNVSSTGRWDRNKLLAALIAGLAVITAALITTGQLRLPLPNAAQTPTAPGGLPTAIPSGGASSAPIVSVPATSTAQNVSCPPYWMTGKGQTGAFDVTVPDGCVIIFDAFAGQVDGTSYNNGFVAAYESGQHTGWLQDGSYYPVPPQAGPQQFCALVNYIKQNNFALSEQDPLPGWPSC